MKFLESVYFYLFPVRLIQKMPWYDLWKEQKHEEFLLIIRIFFASFAQFYIFQYHIFDVQRPAGGPWFEYRYGMAVIMLLTSLIYFWSPLQNIKLYKFPAFLVLWLMCVMQAKAMTWDPSLPYFYSFVWTFIAVLVLRETALLSFGVALLFTGSQWPFFIEANTPTSNLVICTIGTLLFSFFSRVDLVYEVRHFHWGQENMEMQRKFILVNMDLIQQIRGFLPKEISRRMQAFMNNQRMTTLQATHEVLKPRKVEVACLFSDIRGFTQGSKDLDGFVKDNFFPSVKECTAAIEHTTGIPRKIGDLVFAYYDHQNVKVNLVNCLYAAKEITAINAKVNEASKSKIKRNVLISSGDAVVGNLGGIDSSIEITAIGTPVNFLGRLDELIKRTAVASQLSESDIVLSDQTSQTLEKMLPSIEKRAIDLKGLSLQIRDFPDEQYIWFLPLTTHNRAIITELFNTTHQFEQKEAI